MWMMGYNDGSDFNMIPDTAFTGRKIHPLVPRTNTATATATATATNNSSTSTQAAPPCFSRIHAASDLLAQYHQLGEQRGVREFNTVPQVMVSSRWNPTPEQLRALEELYRRGTRTPSAEQIQQITSQLRRFGKIEGKNVFYWFQNHKARERQKRRRQMESHDDIPVMCTSTDHQKKESSGGASRAVYETKNWAPSKNCTTTTSVQYHLHHHQQQETVKGTENRTEGWVHFDDEELHQLQRRNSINNPVDKNATWHMTQLTCPPSPSSSVASLHDVPHFISATNCPREAVRIMGATMDHKLINNPNNNKTSLPPHDLSLFVPSYMSRVTHDRNEEDDEAQTLELFPLGYNIRNGEKDRLAADEKSSMMNPNPSYQFFEFIPLKN